MKVALSKKREIFTEVAPDTSNTNASYSLSLNWPAGISCLKQKIISLKQLSFFMMTFIL